MSSADVTRDEMQKAVRRMTEANSRLIEGFRALEKVFKETTQTITAEIGRLEMGFEMLKGKK